MTYEDIRNWYTIDNTNTNTRSNYIKLKHTNEELHERLKAIEDKMKKLEKYLKIAEKIEDIEKDFEE